MLRPSGKLLMMGHVRSPGFRGRFQDWIQPVWTRLTDGQRPGSEGGDLGDGALKRAAQQEDLAFVACGRGRVTEEGGAAAGVVERDPAPGDENQLLSHRRQPIGVGLE